MNFLLNYRIDLRIRCAFLQALKALIIFSSILISSLSSVIAASTSVSIIPVSNDVLQKARSMWYFPYSNLMIGAIVFLIGLTAVKSLCSDKSRTKLPKKSISMSIHSGHYRRMSTSSTLRDVPSEKLPYGYSLASPTNFLFGFKLCLSEIHLLTRFPRWSTILFFSCRLRSWLPFEDF